MAARRCRRVAATTYTPPRSALSTGIAQYRNPATTHGSNASVNASARSRCLTITTPWAVRVQPRFVEARQHRSVRCDPRRLARAAQLEDDVARRPTPGPFGRPDLDRHPSAGPRLDEAAARVRSR